MYRFLESILRRDCERVRVLRIFIGSSGNSKSIRIADAIKTHLEERRVADVTVWNDGVFLLSRHTIESLIQALDEFHYAIFVFDPVDYVDQGNGPQETVRDNVLLELGLFAGALGIKQTAIVMPSDRRDFRLPTDLFGITVGQYDSARVDDNPRDAVGKACNEIQLSIEELGKPRHWRGTKTKLQKVYEGPRGYYEAAVDMLRESCRSIALLQYSSTLILGSQEGLRDEQRFYELLLQQVRKNAQLHHITSLSIMQQHLKSPSRSYPRVCEALQELDREGNSVRVRSERETMPIRVIPESHSVASLPLELSTGQAFAVQREDGRTEALTIANIGRDTACFRILGPKMEGLLRKCETFYATCEVLNWDTLLRVLEKSGVDIE